LDFLRINKLFAQAAVLFEREAGIRNGTYFRLAYPEWAEWGSSN
jgi:hypothetical protein